MTDPRSPTNPDAPRATQRPPPVRRGVGGVLLLSFMLLVGLGVLRISPVIVYRCEPGTGGAHCEITYRYAGLFVLQRVDLAGIQRATGSTIETSVASSSSSNSSPTKESISTVTLYGAEDRELHVVTDSGLIGADADTLASEITVIAHQAQMPFLRWQASWLPLLFASLMLLISVPTLVDSLRVALTNRRGNATIYWLEFGVMAIPLAVGWILALMGAFP